MTTSSPNERRKLGPAPLRSVEEHLERVHRSARAFAVDASRESGVSLDDLTVAPDLGTDSIARIDTWLASKVPVRDPRNDHWFGLGAWLGESLRLRHGGAWTITRDDPRAWRVGFSKVLLTVAPHALIAQVPAAGSVMGRTLDEIARVDRLHDEARKREGTDILADRYTARHYEGAHRVWLAQWMVIDMATLRRLWAELPVHELRAALAVQPGGPQADRDSGMDRLNDALAALDGARPAAAQTDDRGLYEAVARSIALRSTTQPLTANIVETLCFPALHIGSPASFPPLDADDLAKLERGADPFVVFIDVVPYERPAFEDGLLGTFARNDLASPYPDDAPVAIGGADWILVDPSRIKPQLDRYAPERLLAAFDRFLAFVRDNHRLSFLERPDRRLAEAVAGALTQLKTCINSLDSSSALALRLLPPPWERP